jgi:hypothetical protein
MWVCDTHSEPCYSPPPSVETWQRFSFSDTRIRQGANSAGCDSLMVLEHGLAAGVVWVSTWCNFHQRCTARISVHGLDSLGS